MTPALSVKYINQKKYLPLVLAGGYLITGIAALQTYIQMFSVNWILGIMAIFVTPGFAGAKKGSMRFAWAAALFTLLYWMIPAKTFLFFAIISGLFFFAETFYGHIRFVWVLTVVVMSPIFEYITNVFSFPLRLALTSFAAKLMQYAGQRVHSEGNMLISDRAEFSVDPACMGLHMLIASLLTGIILIGIFEKKHAKRISPVAVVILMTGICLLNGLSNLFRIICLVHFKVVPDSFFHQLTGLVCFIVYVLLPSAALMSYQIKRSPKYVLTDRASFAPAPKIRVVPHILLLAIICVVAYRNKDANGRILIADAPRLSITGYQCTPLPNHITKIENQKALIYIKSVAGFYSSDHQPTICWRGSGYQFKQVQERKIGNVLVYAAVLEKGGDKLYTAWWYDDGKQTTISQWEWRWRALAKSYHYSLINVTTASAAELEKEITKFVSIKRG